MNATLTTHAIAEIRNGNFRNGRTIAPAGWLVSKLLRESGWQQHIHADGTLYTREHCGRYQELRIRDY